MFRRNNFVFYGSQELSRDQKLDAKSVFNVVVVIWTISIYHFLKIKETKTQKFQGFKKLHQTNLTLFEVAGSSL